MAKPIPEHEVEASLRDATADLGETWVQARFVRAAEAERRGRPIVAAARTVRWDELPPEDGWVLRPYGVHQHTLVVGVEPAASPGIAIDRGMLRGRTW